MRGGGHSLSMFIDGSTTVTISTIVSSRAKTMESQHIPYWYLGMYRTLGRHPLRMTRLPLLALGSRTGKNENDHGQRQPQPWPQGRNRSTTLLNVTIQRSVVICDLRDNPVHSLKLFVSISLFYKSSRTQLVSRRMTKFLNDRRRTGAHNCCVNEGIG